MGYFVILYIYIKSKDCEDRESVELCVSFLSKQSSNQVG